MFLYSDGVFQKLNLVSSPVSTCKMAPFGFVLVVLLLGASRTFAGMCMLDGNFCVGGTAGAAAQNCACGTRGTAGWLQLLLAAVARTMHHHVGFCVCCHPFHAAASFAYSSGNRLYADGRPFYHLGVNAYW